MTHQSLTDALSTEALAAMLAGGPSDADRCAAAAALGRRGGPEAVDALAQRLRHRISATVSDACADALALIGEPAVPALAQLVGDRGSGPYAARALQRMGGREAAVARDVVARERIMVKYEHLEEVTTGSYEGRPWYAEALVWVAMIVLLVAFGLDEADRIPWWLVAAAGAVFVADQLHFVYRKRRRLTAARRYLDGEDISATEPDVAYFVDSLSHEDLTEDDPERTLEDGSPSC